MDAVIIGSGNDAVGLAQLCLQNGLATLVVNSQDAAPHGWTGEWIRGKAVISSHGLVTVLDRETGDERKLIPTKAVVLALDSDDIGEWAGRMLGITKLGAKLTGEMGTVQVDRDGSTGAEGIYATGSCASAPTPDLFSALLNYCKATSFTQQGE